MKNKKLSPIILGILIVITILLFQDKTEMSFYKHRECFVSNASVGCEAKEMALTINYQEDPTFRDTGSCQAFMEWRGCQPENCYYYDTATCDGLTINEMVDNHCDTDEECVERFENTGYRCFKDHILNGGRCYFEGNHLPAGYAVRTDAPKEETLAVEPGFNLGDWARDNETPFMILATLLLAWLLLGMFSGDHNPRKILK